VPYNSTNLQVKMPNIDSLLKSYLNICRNFIKTKIQKPDGYGS